MSNYLRASRWAMLECAFHSWDGEHVLAAMLWQQAKDFARKARQEGRSLLLEPVTK